MSMIKKPGFMLALALLAVVALAVGSLDAQAIRLRPSAKGPAAGPIPGNLPAVDRGPMNITPVAGEALSVLSFDDGSCESGLGAGVTVTDLVDFDVPTQCIQAGLDIVGLTTRMNSGIGTAFAWAQAGATPPGAGAVPTTGVSAIPAFGPCPATALTTRAVGPGAAVITGTSNFFAGLKTPTGFAGRDSNGPPAGRIWLNCGGCGMTQYTPTTLSGLGLGGNWMIRVTVEDQDCVPVELMDFSIE
jgi:hypothetical protein